MNTELFPGQLLKFITSTGNINEGSILLLLSVETLNPHVKIKDDTILRLTVLHNSKPHKLIFFQNTIDQYFKLCQNK